MDYGARSLKVFATAILAVAAATPLSLAARADDQCSGHQLLPTPRQEQSCQIVVPQVFDSPDGKTHALVYLDDISLYATPDMESRVVFRTGAGDTLTSQDLSSARGTDGYYVAFAQWSPDSQYFVFSMMSSGGHSPWSFPMKVYSVAKNQIANFSAMIGGGPTIAQQFQFSGPHTVVADTWKQAGDLTDQVPVSVDLDAAFAKLPASPSAN